MGAAAVRQYLLLQFLPAVSRVGLMAILIPFAATHRREPLRFAGPVHWAAPRSTAAKNQRSSGLKPTRPSGAEVLSLYWMAVSVVRLTSWYPLFPNRPAQYSF